MGGFWFWGWFQFLGGVVSVPFLLVSVLLDAVGCCFYIGALVGLVVWFLWRFLVFVEFCQFIPSPICKFLNFRVGLFIVQLETSTRLILNFSKALGFDVVLALGFFGCFVLVFLTFSHLPTFWETVKPFIFCRTFFDKSLAIT